MKKLTVIFIVAVCLMMEQAESCKRSSDDIAVPRRQAYPRVNLYDSAYTAVDSLPLRLEVNSSASVTVSKRDDGITWVDVAYPRYNAVIRYTVQEASGEKLEKATANRMERAELNAGGYPTELTELTSLSGINSTIMLTRSASVTPVQIIATDRRRFILSGVAEFRNADIEADAPAVEAVQRDMIHSAKNLSPIR